MFWVCWKYLFDFQEAKLTAIEIVLVVAVGVLIFALAGDWSALWYCVGVVAALWGNEFYGR